MPKSIKLFRDQEKARRYRNRQRRRNYNKTRTASKAYQSWEPDDERLVLSFRGIDAELSKVIGRGVRAIQIKRSRLLESGRLDIPSNGTFGLPASSGTTSGN